MKKLEALEAAIHAVEARGESYGDVRENHERIAALWSVVFGKAVTPEQVVLAMTCVKVARLMETLRRRNANMCVSSATTSNVIGAGCQRADGSTRRRRRLCVAPVESRCWKLTKRRALC
jgi:hypothetical protein